MWSVGFCLVKYICLYFLEPKHQKITTGSPSVLYQWACKRGFGFTQCCLNFDKPLNWFLPMQLPEFLSSYSEARMKTRQVFSHPVWLPASYTATVDCTSSRGRLVTQPVWNQLWACQLNLAVYNMQGMFYLFTTACPDSKAHGCIFIAITVETNKEDPYLYP